MSNPAVYACPLPELKGLRVRLSGAVEVYRCLTDFSLLTLKDIQKGRCAGHKVAQPVVLSDWEVIKLWLRLHQ